MTKQIYEILCAKDEVAAKEAAKEFISSSNTEEFEKLSLKMDFLFDFVRTNVYNRLESAINKNNYKNIINFFDVYSSYFDDFFSSILAKYADEDLTDEILNILESGTDSQKAYCASYFKHIPDTVAVQDLVDNLSTDFEPLFINCAAALGKMKEKISFEKYKADLLENDDFTRLNAVKFLVAYGDKSVVNELINAMQNSGMSENIAGEIATLISPLELFSEDFMQGALLFNQIINGLGEILPLENIFFYDIYDVANFLISDNSPYSALLLFNLKYKSDIFTQNDEYIFDLDKNIKNEIFEIKNLLFSKDKTFWAAKKALLKSLFEETNPFLSALLNVVQEENFVEFVPEIKNLLETKNETLICELVSTLKSLGALSGIDKNTVIINNENLKAIFNQMFV